MALPLRQIVLGLLLVGSVWGQTQAKRVILLLGPPGAGKTTQSERLKAALGIPIVSMADVLRGESRGTGGFNKRLQDQIAVGELVSDEMANSLMKKRLLRKDCERGFIVDGYPYTAKQAEYFEALLVDLGLPRPTVIHLSIPDAEANDRLARRGRAGDSPANAERRIVEYRSQAELLLARYPDAVTIDGAQSPDAVAGRIRQALRY